MSHGLRSLQPRLQIPIPVPAFGFRFLASDSRLFVLDSLLPVAGPGYCQRLTAMWALASLLPVIGSSAAVPRLLVLDYWLSRLLPPPIAGSSGLPSPSYWSPGCWLLQFAVPELLVPGQSSGPDSRGCPTSNPRECIHSTVAGSTRSLRSVQRRSSI